MEKHWKQVGPGRGATGSGAAVCALASAGSKIDFIISPKTIPLC